MFLEKKWGQIREYILNQVCTVKMIVILPGEETSFHYHRLRDDMWVILSEGMEVQVGKNIYHPKAGDEFVISAGIPHRLAAGENQGRVLEIDFGFSSEDDTYEGEAGE
ncbi:MAG: cupin domain-containing protein [Actinomycetota bacterium]|nr:cupin domain-containing protein [Actinomycetota bacterium]